MRGVFLYMIIWLFMPGLGLAQKKFMAYRMTGTVTYTTQNKKQNLKIGRIIPETATVDVGENSSVIFICEQASKPLTLKKGSYKLSAYTASCDPRDESVTANYLKYVWWQMTNPNRSVEDERKKNRGTAGAVSRGCPGVEFLVPDTLNYYTENILLRWKVFSPDSRAVFMLYEYLSSPIPLLSLPLRKEELDMDSLKKWMTPGVPYFWNIILDGNEACPRKLIQVWDEENFREFMDSTHAQLIPGLDEAESSYLIGYILETHLFFGEAFKYYQMARKAKPGDDRYKRTVQRFRKMYNEED